MVEAQQYEAEMKACKKLRQEDPVFADPAQQADIEMAQKLRTQAKLAEAMKLFEGVVSKQPADDMHSVERVWLQTQILKTQYHMGQYLQALESVSEIVEGLDTKYDFTSQSDNAETEIAYDQRVKYLFFKLICTQARLQRKTRQLSEADDTCSFLIDYVKDCIENKQEVQRFWRFGVKAAYLKATILAVQMEFKIPRALFLEFALPTLRTLCEKFQNVDFEKEEGVALRCADMLGYRKIFAKFRRLGYFVGETEANYTMLLYDELKVYGLYDFTEFDAANPIEKEVPAGEEKIEAVGTKDIVDILKKPVEKAFYPEAASSGEPKEIAAAKAQTAEINRKSNFKVELGKIDLSRMEDYTRLAGFRVHQNPYYQVFQTLLGLAKIKKFRLKTEEATEILTFMVKLCSLIIFGNEENTESLCHISLFQEIADTLLNQVNQAGDPKYDSQDRPKVFAEMALDTVNKIYGSGNTYVHAKALAAVGKAYLGRKEREEAESRFYGAIGYIKESFTKDHPLVCKFQAYLVEAFNHRDESKERNKLMNDICDENLQIVEQAYGKDSLFCIKPMYTAYTARLHRESIQGCEEVLCNMAKIKYDDKPMKQNQFIYKAILIDTMILMGQATKESIFRVELTLKNTFEQQMSYCEGDANHPFLEEVVSIFANFFEQMGSYQNAFLMWSKFLRIQQSMFGGDREQMITTYKKMAALSVAIQQPQHSLKFLELAEQLQLKYGTEGSALDEEKATDEQKKAALEEESNTAFQMYLAAQQAHDFAKALIYIEKQTACLQKLYGVRSHRVCSNFFLTGQCFLRLMRYEECLDTITKAIELMKVTAEDFGADLDICVAKFNTLKANVCFILQKYDLSLAAAEIGIEASSKIDMTKDPEIARSMRQTKRDLTSVKVRALARSTGKNALDLRAQADGITPYGLDPNRTESMKQQQATMGSGGGNVTSVYAQAMLAANPMLQRAFKKNTQ